MSIFGFLPINNMVSVTLSLSLSHPAFCPQMSCTGIPDTWMALPHYFSTAVFLYSTSSRLPSLLCEILLLWPPAFSLVLTFMLGAATHSVWIKHTVVFAIPIMSQSTTVFLSFCVFSSEMWWSRTVL